MPFQPWNAHHDFTSKLDSMDDISELPEMTQLRQFFREQGSSAAFGLIIGKNCEIECAVGDCLSFLGYHSSHVASTSIMRFLAGIQRQLILSIMPSSFGYRNSNTQHLKITFTNERTKQNHNFELVSKLLSFPQKHQTQHGLQLGEKTCVACVAKKPENQDNSCQEPSLGIIVLYLDQTTFKVVKVDSSACLAAKLSDNFFLGKSLQEFCRRNEWPTVDLILETAPRVEGACAELTFVVDGRNVATRASMLRSFSADEPHQLRCEILKSLPEPVCRSMSLAVPEPSTSTIMLSNNATEFEVHDGATFGLNRTFSTPPEVAVVPGPTKRRNSRKGRARETQLSRLDSVIDSVASASTEVTNSEPSLLKSMLETKRPLDSFQNDGGWPLVTEPEPYNSPKCFQSAILPGMDFPNPETKKKRQKASKPRKTARKQPEEFKPVAEPQEMYPTGSYPPGFSGGQMPPPQFSQSIPESQQMNPRSSTMFNPNMPSSSRAGPMTSSAGYMPMGHPNMNQQMMFQQQQQQQQMPMQQHPQMQQMMAQNNSQQWSQPNPNMYHPSQMFYNQNGQRPMPPGFMPQQPQQIQQQIPQQTAPKKANKRKVQRQQEQAPPPQMMQQHMQQAATSQQMMGTQPPMKQQFLNPMNGFPNGSPQFNGANPPMNHLTPFHPNQQPGHYDWNKAATTNAAAQATNMPSSRSEQIRSDLRASISNRQHASPQQPGAMMSPNDLQQARFMCGPGTSISPPTILSPPRPTNVPHPGHAASQAYGPSSISQPSSAQSDQTSLFSPKNAHLYNNNNNPNGFHPPGAMPPPQMTQQQNLMHPPLKSHLAEVSMLKEFPVLSLEDCKEVLQDPELYDYNFGGFDMISKQGFEFNFEESSKLVQRILPC